MSTAVYDFKTNNPGGGVQVDPPEYVNYCKKKCAENPFCTHIQYRKSDTLCELKGINTNDNFITGIKKSNDNSFVRLQGEIPNSYQLGEYDEGSGFPGCEARCAANSSCAYYTYQNTNVCRLNGVKRDTSWNTYQKG